jgi:hypothetical protein
MTDPTIPACADGSGTINVPGALPPTPAPPPTPYAPPAFCEPGLDRSTEADSYQEAVAAEALLASGAPLNVFRLLGVHEQGRLVDLVGQGRALNGSAAAFDGLAGSWVSPQAGLDVLTAPAWLGYDFGVTLTSYGQPRTEPGAPAAQEVTALRVAQPTAGRRALQVRVDRSDGDFGVDPAAVRFTGAGDGVVRGFAAGSAQRPGDLMLSATSATQFAVFFADGGSTVVVGVATVGQRFVSPLGCLDLVAGPTPFAPGDLFTLPVELRWQRVDVVNLPDQAAPAMVRLRQAAAARYWRLVPTSFSGASAGEPWEVASVELFDYQATRLDDVQDWLFQENRDRDYARVATQIKVAYTPTDSVSDLTKFGFQIGDSYTFTTVFAHMVARLGRPIVVGDVLELPPELAYDHNLRPVRKLLEVTDASWAADGFTNSWRPVTFRFQASHLIPSVEHRDIVGTVDTQKYGVDDATFFEGIEQVQTAPLTATEAVAAEARAAAPEKGTDVRELASAANRFGQPGSYDGVGLYVQDGLPPDGQPYEQGYKLPDVAGQLDGAWFRLNYDPATKIPSRLYRFNAVKNQWVHMETDRRAARNAHKPSQQAVLDAPVRLSPTSRL